MTVGVVTPDTEPLVTIDELAATAGLTVRTTRYYATLGLLPPPSKRGRLAHYGDHHRARLELVRALQDHGFTLAAIEKYFARIPADATPEDLAVQRAILLPWSTGTAERLTRRELEARARRGLSDADLKFLERILAIRVEGDSFEVLPPFAVAIALMEVDIPVASMIEAGDAIAHHMDALADDLTTILRTRVLAPLRDQGPDMRDDTRLEQTMSRLRELTLQAVVAGFQRAANNVIERSLSPRDGDNR